MKTNKNVLFTICSIFLFINVGFSQNIGINVTGASPDPSALLDIDAATTPSLGILIPRISLQAVNLASPVTSPATSLLVYNLASAGSGTNAVVPGYYYWDGTKWLRLANGFNATDSQTLSVTGNTLTISNGNSVSLPNDAWKITGNAGTTSTVNFLGTTDNQDLVFKRNNGFSGLINQLLANTSFGYNALNTTFTGMNNTAIGYTALQSLTGGSFNTTVGSYASRLTAGGSYNSALGYKALEFNTGGNFNTGIGVDAIGNNTSGNRNVALGYQALQSNTTGNDNVAVGAGAAKDIGNTGNSNIAIGRNALLGGSTTPSLNVASNNIAIGFESMKGTLGTASTGNNNVAVGNNSLRLNSSGTRNTAIGTNALQNYTESLNTAVGYNALSSTTTGSYNVAVGIDALAQNTVGLYNVAVGSGALLKNTTDFNTAVGHGALQNNTTANYNTALGSGALYSNSTGGVNTGIGASALSQNTTGAGNTAVGHKVLRTNTVGSLNTGMGLNSLDQNTTGNNNTAYGYSALMWNTTGTGNTAIGFGAGSNTVNVTNSYNTFIGYGADAAPGSYTNATSIGYNSIVAGNNALVLGSTGATAPFVGIGKTAPIRYLDVYAAGVNNIAQFETNTAFTYVTLKATGDVGHNGIANSGSDVLTLYTNSTERVRVDANGNVGVGVTNPLNRFHAQGNSATFAGRIQNTNASGTGAIAIGQNVGGSYLPAGSGLSASGGASGLVADALSTTGTGVRSMGNSLSTYPALASGSGGAFAGAEIGVYGNAGTSVNTTNIAGGYFSNNVGDYAYVGYRTAGNVSQKINGTGAVSTIVKNTKNELVNLYCPEAPEVLFQDFGKGQLINGVAQITLDETFTKNVRISEKHPLRVIIQLEGDCKGVYVTDKTTTGFVVKELQGGNSNVSFTYFVTANRADAYNEDGTLFSKFEDVRYGEAPAPAKTKNEAKEEVRK